jgi:diaminopimelate epimerase
VAAVLLGQMDRAATVEVLGGDLGVEWRQSDGHVLLTGPALPVYRGTIADPAQLSRRLPLR